jgi:pimeloyl-ACP methyl ester carboxylesterase
MKTFGRTVLAVAATSVALVGAAAAHAAACSTTTKVQCTEVDVPLDRTGAVPGTIPLHVEVLPSASGPARGVLFLVAGGPGQGSASTFDLRSREMASFYRFLFPGYTLVAYDDRGTGQSGLLRCNSMSPSASWEEGPQLAAACAAELGARAAFYSTADHADDLEAVRAALGYDRIAIWGVSYGTKLALAYAQAYPSRVSRLLLDSVEPLGGPDPFESPVLQSMPATLAAYCAGGACSSATADYAGDVTALANELATAPLEGTVHTARGDRSVRLGALDFLGLVVDEDLNAGLAAELPAAVHAARTGDPSLLLRDFALDGDGTGGDVSWALYLATVCHDGPFPWQPGTAVADRATLVQAAVAGLPEGALGPFGSWAAAFGSSGLCLDWPTPAGAETATPSTLPDVPMLAVSGGLDLRTPTAGAAATVARFPQGRLLVVPGVGHSVLTADPSGCSQRAVRTWMLGGNPPVVCDRAKPYVAAVPAIPAAIDGRLTAARTRTFVLETLREAEATWLMSGASHVAGIRAGTLTTGDRGFTLDGYSAVTGIALSGKVTVTSWEPPLRFAATLHVRGRATGSLRVRGGKVTSSLHVS